MGAEGRRVAVGIRMAIVFYPTVWIAAIIPGLTVALGILEGSSFRSDSLDTPFEHILPEEPFFTAEGLLDIRGR